MQSIEFEAIAESLGRYVGMSHFSMARLFARELQKANIDLTIEQSRILFTLFLQDGRTQQDIAHMLMQEKSSTSRLVHTLERKGYVQRKQDIQDERQKHVFLTEKGFAMQEPCTRIATQVQDQLKEHFTAEEWDQMIHLVRKLSQVVRIL